MAKNCLTNCNFIALCYIKQKPPLTDPRDAVAQHMLNIPCRIIIMVIKPFLLLGLAAEYTLQISTVGVINSWPTTIRSFYPHDAS